MFGEYQHKIRNIKDKVKLLDPRNQIVKAILTEFCPARFSYLQYAFADLFFDPQGRVPVIVFTSVTTFRDRANLHCMPSGSLMTNDPLDRSTVRPVVIIIFKHIVFPSFYPYASLTVSPSTCFKIVKNKKKSREKYIYSQLASRVDH